MSFVKCIFCGKDFDAGRIVRNGDKVTCTECGGENPIDKRKTNKKFAIKCAEYIIESDVSEDVAIDHVCRTTENKEFRKFCKNIQNGQRNAIKEMIRDEVKHLRVIERIRNESQSD